MFRRKSVAGRRKGRGSETVIKREGEGERGRVRELLCK